MPIAFLTAITFPVSLAVDVQAFPDEATRPAFRFRYLSEAQRMSLVEALHLANTATTRPELRAALIPELEKHFVRTENMPEGYAGWDSCTVEEWLELGNLVLANQDLSEIDLKKSKSLGGSPSAPTTKESTPSDAPVAVTTSTAPNATAAAE